MGIESNFAGGSVSITGYPSSAEGAQVDSTQSGTRDSNYTLLDGTALGERSSGGPVWIETTGGASVVGVVSSESVTNGTGYNNLITTAEFNRIEAWVQQDDATSTPTPTPTPTPTLGLDVLDTTTGQLLLAAAQPYTGPVSGLTSEYITRSEGPATH
jgi:hypothetical protein